MTQPTVEQLAADQENKDRAASLMGHHAGALLANPAYASTWEFLRKGILEGWAGLPASDKDTAAMLHLQIKLLDNLQARFESLVKAGETADAAMRRRIEEELEREEAAARGQQNVFVRGVRNLRGRMAA